MNVAKARARRYEIIEEEQKIAGKHRRTQRDIDDFQKLQTEFDKLTAEINVDEIENGPENREGIRPGPQGSFYDHVDDSRLHPMAREWVRKVADRMREGGGDVRSLTVSGDIITDFPVGRISTKPERPRYVADLVGRKVIEGPTGTWLRETAFTNAAAPVAKGDEKPESAFTLTRETSELQTIAHLISGIHNVDLADETNLQQVVGGKLFEGLRLELDDQIINGSGTPPALQGILDAGSTVATIPFDAAGGTFVTLRIARTALENDNIQAVDLVMAPDDVQALDLERDANDQYYFSGPIEAGADGNKVWSARVISTPAIAAGTAIMGDFQKAVVVLTDGSVRLAADPFTGFSTNQTDFRAEGRFAVGIIAPYALRIVDLTA